MNAQRPATLRSMTYRIATPRNDFLALSVACGRARWETTTPPRIEALRATAPRDVTQRKDTQNG